jgi:hypothetical protein
MRKAKKKIFLIIIEIIIVIVAIELILSLVFKSHPSLHEDKIIRPDGILGYEHIPGSSLLYDDTLYKINKQGFRDKEYDPIKGDNTFRILILGDSVTFGIGVNESGTYANILEDILINNDRGINFEVINAGVMGYSNYQELLLYKTRMSDWNPDLLIIGYVYNDIFPDDRSFITQRHTFNHELPPSKFMRTIYETLSKSTLIRTSYHLLFKSQNGDSSDIVNNLLEFKRISEKHNTELLILFFPYLDEANNLKSSFFSPHFFKQSDLRYINMYDLFDSNFFQ